MSTVNQNISAATGIDAGLRAYMLRVYDFVGIGLGVSALSAYGILSLATTTVQSEGAKAFGKGQWLTPFGQAAFSLPAMIAMLCLSLFMMSKLSNGARSSSLAGSVASYAVFAATFGLNLAVIAGSYTSASVTFALATTAVTFGSVSLWAHTSKRDLSGWGSFLSMGLVGLLVAMVGGLLLGLSDAMGTAIAGIGTLLFVGLLAYDTQSIRSAYSPSWDSDGMNRAALAGAVDVFLDIVNLFNFILALGGQRND